MTKTSKESHPDNTAHQADAQGPKDPDHSAQAADAAPAQTIQASPTSAADPDHPIKRSTETRAPDEQDAGQQSEASDTQDKVFKPLIHHEALANTGIEMIADIPVQLSVELGRTKLTIKNILQLGQGSVVELDGLAGEPMDIFVNDYLIAQGEVVVVDEKYGIRITDIITPADRVNRLNGRR